MPIGADMASTMKHASENLQDAIIKAVIKQAAFSIGVQVGLMFVPVIGTAIAGLLSVIQMITGKYYQNQVTKLIASTMAAIQARGEALEKAIMEAGQAVYAEEFPAGRALAMNAEPVAGLGMNIFERAAVSTQKTVKRVGIAVTDTLKSAPKQAKLLPDVWTSGLRPLVKAALNVPVEVAKTLEKVGAVKQGTVSRPLTEVRETANDVVGSFTRMVNPFTAPQEIVGLVAHHGGQTVAAVMKATGNEKGAREVLNITDGVHRGATEARESLTPTGIYNLTTGRESLVGAREACSQLKEQAFAAMDNLKRESLLKMRSPAGRQQMRVSIAKRLRGDPAFMQQMQELRDLEAQEKAAEAARLAQLEAQVGPIKPAAGGDVFVGVAAAAAVAFALNR
jgi:hypothetical protein